jgi:hypothetical protein
VIVALVMPVHGRAALARIVMEQRLRLVYDLAGLGVDAEMVVVGDDENLDTAREFGFHVVESPNPLGRRINDGFEFAFRELGADHAVFNGSDSWLMPGPLAVLPEPGRVRTSRHLALCSADFLVCIPSDTMWGRAPWTISRALMEPSGFRPVLDSKPRGLDGSLRSAVLSVNRKAFWTPQGDPPLRVVDFRRGPWEEQMTPWERLVPRRGAGKLDSWETLATAYPPDLVGQMQRYYATAPVGRPPRRPR